MRLIRVLLTGALVLSALGPAPAAAARAIRARSGGQLVPALTLPTNALPGIGIPQLPQLGPRAIVLPESVAASPFIHPGSINRGLAVRAGVTAAAAATGRTALPGPKEGDGDQARSAENQTTASSVDFDGNGNGREPLRLVITGAPGSGKGTISARLASEYGVVHISAGELLREKAASDPAIAETMRQGKLVPTELVVRVVAERLAKEDVRARGFVLDGFPRRPKEASALKAMLKKAEIKIDATIKLEVERERLLERILRRGRPDDTKEAFAQRMVIYENETKPAVKIISKGTKVLTPDLSDDDKEKNYLSVKSLLEELIAGRPLPGERKLALTLAAWNFLTIGTYYILAPVRSAFLLNSFGPEALPWVYMVGALVTGVAAWAFAKFAHASRRTLIGSTLGLFTASLAAWWAAGLWVSQIPAVSFAYYIFGDLFSIMSVTVFWTYANDRFGPEAAKRSFGLIAAAGPLGAIVGSFLTLKLVAVTGALPLLLAAAVVYAGTMIAFALAERSKFAKPAPKPVAAVPAPVSSEKPGIVDTIKTIWKNPLLLSVAALVTLERLVPDFGNYIFNAMAKAAYPVKEDLIAFGAQYGLWQNVFSLGLSLLLTSWFLRRMGVGKALVGTPLSLAAGLLLFAVSPVLAVAVAFNAVEGLQRYTIFKSAKEATYTVADKAVLYRAKPFIEMFLYRFARGIAGLLLLLLTHQAFLHFGVVGVALAGVPFALLWAWAALKVGREFKKKEG